MAIIILTAEVFGQSAKKYQKAGEEFLEAKKYKDAAAQFTEAIKLEADYLDAYASRAVAYEKMFRIEDAINDYQRGLVFDTDNEDFLYNLARLQNKMEKYKEAIETSNKTIAVNKKHFEVLNEKTKAQLALRQYNNAMTSADQALDIKKNSMNYYLHGKVMMHLKNYEKAEYDFGRSYFYDNEFIPAYVAKSEAQCALKKGEAATATCDEALKITKDNASVYMARAASFKTRNDYPSAINDLSQAMLVAKPTEKEAIHNTRGQYYSEFGQHQAAINDFNVVLEKDKDNFQALYQRAAAYEAVFKLDLAIADYEALRKLSPYDEKAKQMLEDAEKRLFELNREEDPPKLVFTEPAPANNLEIPVPKNLIDGFFKGHVDDASKIKKFQMNGQNVIYDKSAMNPEFNFRLNLTNASTMTVMIEDVYGNAKTYEYKLVKTEIDAPVVNLIAPYASDDGEIYLENENTMLYVEGKIEDESLIKSIYVEGATASYVVDQLNPTFSATINIANKNSITVTAVDAYGNSTEKVFKFNTEGAQLSANNPMGKTWVVFIENSNYSSFASLEGPGKDVTTMKGALANYQIHNIIRKRDMTKAKFEKFFSIELRDMVRSNRVNSLIVWYAGHGKFLNESGYWIPVDAKRDDEFTYFNINSLKAAMQSYSKYITHTLVITDACESGPSFYQAMRATGDNRNCQDWQATRFKSSQVLSSAGYELASDDSQFTKTFANTLNNNPDACISIDKIASKVSEAVAKNARQKPKFGKIQGFEDENGTFFFIKR